MRGGEREGEKKGERERERGSLSRDTNFKGRNSPAFPTDPLDWRPVGDFSRLRGRNDCDQRTEEGRESEVQRRLQTCIMIVVFERRCTSAAAGNDSSSVRHPGDAARCDDQCKGGLDLFDFGLNYPGLFDGLALVVLGAITEALDPDHHHHLAGDSCVSDMRHPPSKSSTRDENRRSLTKVSQGRRGGEGRSMGKTWSDLCTSCPP